MANTMDIPGAGQHRDVVKSGFLNKLSGRSFPYIPQWKRRYCVLSKGKLFYYERSDSRGGEKGAGVINLDYFDQISEAGPKDCKKATNVFIITSQDKSFFDPGRHMFSADTLPDMKDWMRKLQSTLEHIRNNNRTGFSSAPSTPKATKDVSTGGSTGRRKKDNTDNNQNTGSRERKKKEESSLRRKKQVAPSVTSETQTNCEGTIINMEVTEEPVVQEGDEAVDATPELLPVDGPKLEHIRRPRPHGRRNPKSIRILAENQKAISCSALVDGEHENNRSDTKGSNVPSSIAEESENIENDDFDDFFKKPKDEQSSGNKSNGDEKLVQDTVDPEKAQPNSKNNDQQPSKHRPKHRPCVLL